MANFFRLCDEKMDHLFIQRMIDSKLSRGKLRARMIDRLAQWVLSTDDEDAENKRARRSVEEHDGQHRQARQHILALHKYDKKNPGSIDSAFKVLP